MTDQSCPRCGWVFTERDRYCWRCYVTEGAKAVRFLPSDDGRDYFNTGEDDWNKHEEMPDD